MLAAMRNTVSGIFAKTLLFFLVITFAVWGIGDIVRKAGSTHALVSVGDSDITLPDFERELQLIQRNAEGKIPAEVLHSPMMRQQVLQRLIENRLLAKATEEMGIIVGTDLIAKRTKENLAFQNVDGSFNVGAFAAFLRQNQVSETSYRQQIAKETAQELYTNSAQLDQLNLSDAYLTLKALNLGEQRTATLITIASDTTTTIDEKELRAYYDQHKNERYVTPETRTLKLAMISKPSINKAIAGDTSGAAFEEIGYAIDDAVAAGQSIEEALKTAKLEATVHTLSSVEQGSGKNDIEIAATEQGFTLSEGETSGLLSAKDGTYYMVSVVHVTPPTPKAFESVKEEVTTQYRHEKGAELAKEKTLELKKALNGVDTIDAQTTFATKAGASVRETGLLSRPEVGTTKEIPEALHHGIFDGQKGDMVGPVVLENGDYALAIVTSIKVPATAKTPDTATKKALASELNGQVYEFWLRDLVKRYPIQQVAAIPEPQQ